MSYLTPTERRVLLLMIEALSTDEVAERLSIAHSTVKTHRRNLYQKTGTRDSVSLVGWGRRYFGAERLEIDRLLNPEDLRSTNLPRSG